MNALTFPKREPKRWRVFLSAEVDAGSGSFPARIRDISETGALLESDYVPTSGGKLSLHCGEADIRGRVVWADRGWFGLEFDAPLEDGDLSDAAGAKLKVSAPRTYHSGEPLD